jgi:NAD+ kinase
MSESQKKSSRTIAIVSKPQRPDLTTVLPELLTWLHDHGLTPLLDPVSGSYLEGVEVTPRAEIVPRKDMPAHKPELVVMLGGDGTLLATARVFAQSGVPILSVNLGSLGFLTEVRLGELFTTLEGWLKWSCKVDTRSMLHIELWRQGKLHTEFEALNDVVLAKGAIARMAEFNVSLNGQMVARYRADGIIVATPTGSTAYNLAANGPVLAPGLDAMVVTPICPHLLTIRPLVVEGSSQVHIKVEGIPDQTYMTVDGQQAVMMELDDEVHCRRSEYGVKLVRLGATGFFDVLRSKLKWGER